ncbi:MAG: hypothetical protein BWY57_02694 [Betaproteobacteria bacterium ADurb.Bin341]|nr:MAG: hypothetical protein BWY57_02694 [Betaproteobacteria bacterium ADurb.Bin341]
MSLEIACLNCRVRFVRAHNLLYVAQIVLCTLAVFCGCIYIQFFPYYDQLPIDYSAEHSMLKNVK